MARAEPFDLILQEPSGKTLSFQLQRSHTLRTLEGKIEEITMGTPGWPKFQKDQFLIIVQGIIVNERYANNVEIQNIQGIGDRAVLQLVMGQPNPERNQQGNVVSPTAANFKLLSTLNRNTRECVRSAQRDVDPNRRNQYDFPEEETPEEPHVQDLGIELEKMAANMLTMSHIMEDLGNQLKRDESLTNPIEHQRARRKIRNNIDAWRYTGPALRTVSKFVIPLAQPAPRKLKTAQPRT